MGQLYRNTGAAITRGGQRAIARNEVFEPTPWELEHLAYKLEKVEAPGAPAAPAAPAVPTWPLRMTPELYLDLYPTGRHADLARVTIAARPKEAPDAEQHPDE